MQKLEYAHLIADEHSSANCQQNTKIRLEILAIILSSLAPLVRFNTRAILPF